MRRIGSEAEALWRLRRRQFVIVSTDADLGDRLSTALEGVGALPALHVARVDAAADAITSREVRVDAAILDLATVRDDGAAFCRNMRRRGMRAPIILLADEAKPDNVVRYLEAGADEYLTLPLGIGELLARLRAHLRSYEHADGAVLPLGPYDFVPSEKLLIEVATDRRIWLTRKEAGMLRCLYAAGGQLVSAKALLREIWGHTTDLDTQTVATHASRLRRKLGTGKADYSLLVGERGAYRLSFDRQPAISSALPQELARTRVTADS